MVIFFFQAEDGIRGLYVTGVQTCALPISKTSGRAITRLFGRSTSACAHARSAAFMLLSSIGRTRSTASQWKDRQSKKDINRSEERRVGKESRSGWWKYHKKKIYKKRITI